MGTTIFTVDRAAVPFRADLAEIIGDHLGNDEIVQVVDGEWPAGERLRYTIQWSGAFRRRRCIIPASGFFEWTGGKGDKTPHLFTAADGSPVLAFAGLWERWKNPEGDEVLSATVIVFGASDWVIPYHDCMPVLRSG